ncbi:MAG: hypothetical protein AAF526_12710 [Pseudomonadota bacterium]
MIGRVSRKLKTLPIMAVVVASAFMLPTSINAQSLNAASQSCLSVIVFGVPVDRSFRGSQVAEGAGPGEIEVFNGPRHTFLDLGEKSCTVMDEHLSMYRATALLPGFLQEHQVTQVRAEEGWGGEPVTRGTLSGKTIQVYINEGLGGGAAYAISLQPQN